MITASDNSTRQKNISMEFTIWDEVLNCVLTMLLKSWVNCIVYFEATNNDNTHSYYYYLSFATFNNWQHFYKEYCGVWQFCAVHILDNWMYMCGTRLVWYTCGKLSLFCSFVKFSILDIVWSSSFRLIFKPTFSSSSSCCLL